jgi:hypothetical protein
VFQRGFLKGADLVGAGVRVVDGGADVDEFLGAVSA